jgi:hypothetical protein
MIDLESKLVIHEGKGYKLESWAVWWRTPNGLFQTLEAALDDAESIEFPSHMIRSVPVALAEDGVYEERP